MRGVGLQADIADPGVKDVEDLPARIPNRGGAGAGPDRHHGVRIRGAVTLATCKEQLLYEIHSRR